MRSGIDDRLPECYRNALPKFNLAVWELQRELHEERWKNALAAWIIAKFWRDQATKEYKKGNRKKAKELRSKADAKDKEAQAFLDDKRPLSFLKGGR